MERGVEVETLLFDVRDGIATIKLNRPDVLNAINPQVYQELSEVFESLFFNREVRVVILTGAGDRAFAAGADISAMSTFSSAQARSFARLGKRAVDRIVSLPQPVVAAVNGLALGGGCELAMACDFRIASSRAKFGQPEINLGIIPGGGGTQRLPRLVGVARAKWLIFTGEIIDARKALEMGLVNQVVEPEELIPAAEELAKKLMTKSAIALGLAKMAVNQTFEMPLSAGLDYEIECFAECFDSLDQKEGMRAFLEKRPAQFRGE